MDKKKLKNLFKKKSVLITGGTGSLGNELAKIFLTEYSLRRLVIFSRDELKQSEMAKHYKKIDKKEILRFFLGDVRDADRLKFAMKDIDYVVHAAALKHVDLAEYNPIEHVNTNIIGAKNVIESAFDKDVHKVVALSTDKAANPVNLYGATKLVSDKLFVSANNISGDQKTRFSVVRYGNVANSRGSVLPYFLDLKKKGTTHFPITDKDMTRFWITLDESVRFVVECLKVMEGGEIFIPKLKSFKVTDLIKAIDSKAKIKLIGIRPGEKLHEVMCPNEEVQNTLEFKKNYIIYPSINKYAGRNLYNLNLRKRKGTNVNKNFEYNSKDNKEFLSISELKKELKRLKFKIS